MNLLLISCICWCIYCFTPGATLCSTLRFASLQFMYGITFQPGAGVKAGAPARARVPKDRVDCFTLRVICPFPSMRHVHQLLALRRVYQRALGVCSLLHSLRPDAYIYETEYLSHWFWVWPAHDSLCSCSRKWACYLSCGIDTACQKESHEL